MRIPVQSKPGSRLMSVSFAIFMYPARIFFYCWIKECTFLSPFVVTHNVRNVPRMCLIAFTRVTSSLVSWRSYRIKQPYYRQRSRNKLLGPRHAWRFLRRQWVCIIHVRSAGCSESLTTDERQAKCEHECHVSVRLTFVFIWGERES